MTFAVSGAANCNTSTRVPRFGSSPNLHFLAIDQEQFGLPNLPTPSFIHEVEDDSSEYLF
jgi:hypothetical protein